MTIFRQILGLVLALNCLSLSAQFKPVVLDNTSFEGVPHDAQTPDNWQACGLDSSPDILPGPWGVYQKPTDGNTFLGLITRDDNTWEALGQKMPKPFKKERCYKFKVDLSSSPAYAGYSKPTCLRVWVGNSACDRAQLIATSPVIDHYEWKTYEFLFSTEEDYKYIIIECYYKQPSLDYYKGNLLIDNISAFEMCDRA
ncbi:MULTISPECIES: hypothetical protein [unclassified Aureispira]|uniref:hypothetical protein n=1 Tax=unclassified Aureispira TaxID=2649989 RepID=UPI0012DDD1CC|nr:MULTISPECIES: hypothetical protein [unclassified Aureispira]WMX17309.1 hypothetical protein QP953_13090 [Aureispira sp. CCB-E]